MAIVDRHGLPLTVSTHAANRHEVTLAQLSFDFYMIEAKRENLIGNRAYDSDPLNRRLREQGNVSLSAYDGGDGCWYGGNFIPPTSSTRPACMHLYASLVKRS